MNSIVTELSLDSSTMSPSSSIKTWVIEQIKGSTMSQDDMKKVDFVYDPFSMKIEVKAILPIKKDETVISLPLSLCIDTSYIKSNINQNFKPSICRTGEYGMLASFLLVEKYLLPGHSNGKYKSYIDSLGIKPPGIFGWNMNSVKEFMISTTRDVQNQLMAADSDYNVITNSDIFPETYKKTITKESFLWALGIVKSRAIEIEGKLYLLPGMSSLDHADWIILKILIVSV